MVTFAVLVVLLGGVVVALLIIGVGFLRRDRHDVGVLDEDTDWRPHETPDDRRQSEENGPEVRDTLEDRIET